MWLEGKWEEVSSLESEIKRDKTKINISFWSWRKEEEEEEEEEEEDKRKEERRKGKRRSQVWNLSMGVWIRVLGCMKFVYGLGLETPNLIP